MKQTLNDFQSDWWQRKNIRISFSADEKLFSSIFPILKEWFSLWKPFLFMLTCWTCSFWIDENIQNSFDFSVRVDAVFSSSYRQNVCNSTVSMHFLTPHRALIPLPLSLRLVFPPSFTIFYFPLSFFLRLRGRSSSRATQQREKNEWTQL